MTVLLVGEMPPQTWERREDYRRGHSPMFTYPPRSSGHRLYVTSDLMLGEYIHGLTRINLVPEYRAKWPKREEAEALAKAAMARFSIGAPVNHPIPPFSTGAPVSHAFLCGRRVVDAFRPFFPSGYKPWPVDEIGRAPGTIFYCIPHPSGRSLAYNDEDVRLRVRTMFQEVQPLLADWPKRTSHNERRLVRDGH